MIVEILVCRPDGGQALEQKEVPETWFPAAPAIEAQKSPEIK